MTRTVIDLDDGLVVDVSKPFDVRLGPHRPMMPRFRGSRTVG